MSDEKLQELTVLRLRQAQEALYEAQVLSQAGHFRAAVSRSYYAMFYAIQALLSPMQYSTSKHKGTIELFDREFVRTKLVDKHFSKWLHELFDLRLLADYEVLFPVSEQEAQEALQRATEFVQKARETALPAGSPPSQGDHQGCREET